LAKKISSGCEKGPSLEDPHNLLHSQHCRRTQKTTQNEFGSDSHADIRAVHSLGYKIIKGKTAHVSEQRDRPINGKLIGLSINDPYYVKQLIRYVEGLKKFPYTDCSLASDSVFEIFLREAANILTRSGIGYKYTKSNLLSTKSRDSNKF